MTRYIGEVGLDFSKKFIGTKQKQLNIFNFICRKSAEQNKLLSVHSRMAEYDTLRILLSQGVSKAIIHWYSGDIGIIHHFLNAGYYFSVNSSMCATTSGKKIISKIPMERLLVESDGPFSKVGTKRYTPTDLQSTYDVISDTLGVQNITHIVYNNFKRLLAD